MPGDVSLSGIEFQIKGSTSDASNSIQKLIGNLGKLNQALSGATGIKDFAKSMNSLTSAIKKLNGADVKAAVASLSSFGSVAKSLEGLAGISKNIASFANGMANLAKNSDKLSEVATWLNVISGIDLSNLANAGQGLKQMVDALRLFSKMGNEGAGSASKSMGGFGRSMHWAADSAKNLAKAGLKGFFSALAAPLKSATAGVGGLAKSLGGVLGGFKRILGYRIIRSIIKEITQAFQEGTKNLYGWSAAFGGATINGMNFAQTMNSLATSFLYFKNAVGAAVAPLISALAPAIDFVIDKAVALLNVLNQLFARLAGATSWNKAIKKATEYGEAAGGAGAAAKEAMKYLAPFDELNRLPSDNGGSGGGGGGTDYSGMFEEATEFNEDIANFADSLKAAIEAGDWQGVGTLLGNKVNEIVDSIDFAGIGTKVGQSINAWFTTKYWTLETINFSNIGSNIATAFNNAIAEIDFEIIGRSITQKFTILGDLVISAVNTINWGEVGSAIGELIRGAFDQLSEWISEVDWVTFGSNLYHYLLEAVEGMDFASIAESLFKLLGAAIGAAVGLIGSFVNEAWQDIKEYFAQYMPDGWDSNGEDIIKGILEGVKNAVKNIGTWIKTNVWDPFVAGLKSAFGIASPATTMVPYGDDIGEGIKNGIKNPFQNIKDWVQTNILDKIQSALDSGKELVANIKAKVTEIASDVKETVVEVRGKIAQWVDDAKEKVSEGWQGVVESVQDKIAPVEKKLGGMVAEFTGRVKSNGFNSTLGEMTAGFLKRVKSSGFNSTIGEMIAGFSGRKKTSGFNSTLGEMIAQFSGRTEASSFSTTFGAIANFITSIEGWEKDPILSGIASFIAWADNIPYYNRPSINATANIVDWNTSTQGVYGYASGGVINNGVYQRAIPQFASGGSYKAHGSLMIAGEAGPEVVGHIGGRTEVLNRSQLASTMFASVRSAIASTGFTVTGLSGASAVTPDDGMNEETIYRAFLRALNDSDVGDRPIELDGSTIYQSVVKRNQFERRRTGVNPMLTY